MSWKVWIGGVLVGAALVCGGALFALRDTAVGIGGVLAAAFEEPEWSEIEGADRYLEYLLAHPESFSLVAYSVDGEGQPIPGTEIRHNAETPRVLASTVKIVVLSAVARAADEGALKLDEPVRLAEWDSWYLHGYDGGAHPAAYDRIGVAHTEGIATDPAATVPLREVLGAMIRESDNAATDTLVARLGARMQAETERFGHDPLAPLLEDIVWVLDGDACDGSTRPDLSDPGTRAARLAKSSRASTLNSQRAGMHCALPRGTTELYARIMAGVATQNHISPAASATMAAELDWPMELGSNAEEFDAMGIKGGSVPGVLTEAAYAVPKSGDFAGQPRVVVLFANDMSGSAWLAAMASFPQQDLLVKLGTEAAFVEKVRAGLETL